MDEMWGAVLAGVSGLAVIFGGVQVVVRLLAGPVAEIRGLLDEVSSYFDSVIRGKASQGDTLRMRARIDDVSPRTPWPMRRHLRTIDGQVARLSRPGGNVGHRMWPTPEQATQAITHGGQAVARARSYLDRLERWTVRT